MRSETHLFQLAIAQKFVESLLQLVKLVLGAGARQCTERVANRAAHLDVAHASCNCSQPAPQRLDSVPVGIMSTDTKAKSKISELQHTTHNTHAPVAPAVNEVAVLGARK